MASLKEEASGYQQKQTQNIADLEFVNIEDVQVEEEANVEFPYKYITKNGQRYRVPNSVLEQLQNILSEKPAIKLVKVLRKGEGIKTSYTVIPIE